MCGIAGIASERSAVDEGLLTSMRDSMRHRGPDDAGTWLSPDGQVGLAMRRLAIIDLSPAGRQPMTDESGQAQIVFNGEIYNHRDLRRELEGKGHLFRSSSDTEVILHAYRAWGTDCLSRLSGMFAFAIYDRPGHRLFLARDRAGEKPLYYRHSAGRLVFGSELKALMEDPTCPRTVDLNALQQYLAYGYVMGEGCILKGVRKLPPGHAATYEVESDDLRIWSYWQLPALVRDGATREEELVERLEGLLVDAVRRQLVADVPVGVLLSGGMDSSLVTAVAAAVSPGTLKTFTITFPGHGRLDESRQARLIAEHFGTAHSELAAEPASVNLLPRLARQFDEPIADSSLVPTFQISQLVRQHATVALGGDGGDELFGGYRHYRWLQQLEVLRHITPRAVRQQVMGPLARLLPLGTEGRNYVLGFCLDASESVARVNLMFDLAARRRILAPLHNNGAKRGPTPEEHKLSLCRDESTLFRMAAKADFRSYLADDILSKVDRASMLSSLEVRAPFLDHRIVELAFGEVEDAYRATARRRKVLLRLLVQKLLPREFDLDRKQGFEIPIHAWFKEEWGRFIRAVLSETDPRLFDRRTVDELIEGQQRGRRNSNRLFALTMFELWRREYRVSLG